MKTVVRVWQASKLLDRKGKKKIPQILQRLISDHLEFSPRGRSNSQVLGNEPRTGDLGHSLTTTAEDPSSGQA